VPGACPTITIRLFDENWTTGRVVRFDLGTDPRELAPLRADDDSGATELLEHCRALDDAYASRPSIDSELDSALKAQLEALGYVQDDEPAAVELRNTP